jgi:hypothetical protein
MGIAKDGTRKESFQRGMELRGNELYSLEHWKGLHAAFGVSGEPLPQSVQPRSLKELNSSIRATFQDESLCYCTHASNLFSLNTTLRHRRTLSNGADYSTGKWGGQIAWKRRVVKVRTG